MHGHRYERVHQGRAAGSVVRDGAVYAVFHVRLQHDEVRAVSCDRSAVHEPVQRCRRVLRFRHEHVHGAETKRRYLYTVEPVHHFVLRLRRHRAVRRLTHLHLIARAHARGDGIVVGVRSVAFALLALTATAHADRSTVMSIGGTFDGMSKANETQNDPKINGGARVSLSFEDATLAYPEPGTYDTDTRLVPELFAGFVSNDVRALGYVGAGLRAELQFARNYAVSQPPHMRMVLYLAARAKIIGKHQDAGGELMFGAYVFGRGTMRVGWEGGLGVIKHPEWNAQESPELEVLLNVYV